MKAIKNRKGNETLIYTDNLEFEAYAQVKALSNFEPYTESKIRIMPDAHAGKGCTVGTTMTITDKVTPNLVGVDIGCGMLTINLYDRYINFNNLDKTIRTQIPGGFNIHSSILKDFDFTPLRCSKYVDLERAMLSVGSLGGGNHFIEVGQATKTGELSLIIHSGSRKLGGDVCKYYQDKAIKKLNDPELGKEKIIKHLKAAGREKEINTELRNSPRSLIPKELAYLSGQDFADYLNDMAVVQRFASINRETMVEIIIREMGFKEASRFETIHNYIDFTRMILRKGAVSAEKGEKLIIPINMRDGSLLCIGKGNENWNYSAPHGAGRLMSRSKAKQVLNMDDFISSMQGVYTTSVIPETIDEAPLAYKPIDEITSSIGDTVEILDTLKPLYNFKAH